MNTGFMSKLRSDDLGRLVLRLSVGGLMLFHGVHKLQHGVGGIGGMLSAKGLPSFLAYGVYVGEVAAPLLILAGFLTRPAAAVVVFNMVVAVALVHGGDVFSVDQMGAWAIELPMLYALGALALVFTGAGRFSASRGRGPWD